MTIKRMYHSLRLLLIRGGRNRAEYLKKHHILGGIGDGCKWDPWVLPLYPELIILHNNVCVHKTVHFIPHDMINGFLNNCGTGMDFGSWEAIGPIEIHDNVYISMNASIMLNVEIGKNCIIGAGCIVSNDIPENSVVSGNPAKVIGKFSTYMALRKMKAKNNPKFKNQHLPKEIADKAWEQFRAQRENIKR